MVLLRSHTNSLPAKLPHKNELVSAAVLLTTSATSDNTRQHPDRSRPRIRVISRQDQSPSVTRAKANNIINQ
jgi:hypothetical protein